MLIDALQYSKPSRERFLEWRAAGVDAVHVTVAIWETAEETLRVIGQWNALARENSDLVALVSDLDDISAISASGRTGVILGFQNVAPFQDDLDLVGGFREAGIRIAQLTYNAQNSAGAGCWEADEAGLSRTYGRSLIKEMNDVGILVDVSHSNDKTAMDAAAASSVPIAITHANPREFVGEDVELPFRNKRTETMRAVTGSGGVVGLSMYPRLAPGGADCTLELFCDMVEWTVERLGVEHVAFGSDFYTGWDEEIVNWWRCGRWSRSAMVTPVVSPIFGEWFDNGRGWQSVIAELRRRGGSDHEVGLLSGGNWQRLFGQTWRADRSAAQRPVVATA